MAEKQHARDLLVKAPYDKDTLYSSLLLGLGRLSTHVDAERTRYTGTKHGKYVFRDEAPPHVERHVTSEGTDGMFGIVKHADLSKVQFAEVAANRRNNRRTRNKRRANKARANRRRSARNHGYNNNNTENE